MSEKYVPHQDLVSNPHGVLDLLLQEISGHMIGLPVDGIGPYYEPWLDTGEDAERHFLNLN